MKAAIMVPTYNEKDNIETLVRGILDIDGNSGTELSIVVVDDNSPDGTGDILDGLKDEFSGKIQVVHRKDEKGRGTAGIAGFKYCLGLDVDCIIEMDADLSHDPRYLPVFFDAIRHYDIVIGSRYVYGGDVEDCPYSRRVISAIANYIYKFILGIKIQDLSGGYKCYSRKVLASLDFENFFSKGYSVGVETLFRSHKKGFSFLEIPIIFHNRSKGRSKFSLKEGFTALLVIMRLVANYGRAGNGWEKHGR